MQEEFPQFSRELLYNPLKRNMFTNMLLGLLKHMGEPTLEQCMVRVARSGYTITKGDGTEVRAPGRIKSADAKPRSTILNPGTLKFRLLSAFWDTGDDGLTAEEAQIRANLAPRSNYWTRVSELLDVGYLEVVEDAAGDPVVRNGESGAKRRVYRITPLGSQSITELL
jgi:hypothetical protein